MGAVDLQLIHSFIHDWWSLKKQTIFNLSPLHPHHHINPTKASALYHLLLTGEICFISTLFFLNLDPYWNYWCAWEHEGPVVSSKPASKCRKDLIRAQRRESPVAWTANWRRMVMTVVEKKAQWRTASLSPGSRHEPPPAHIHPGQVRASRCKPHMVSVLEHVQRTGIIKCTALKSVVGLDVHQIEVHLGFEENESDRLTRRWWRGFLEK